MNCLKEEFTVHGRGLPEEIKGQVMETETYHLTVEARKRKPFLSHLPLFADIKFVEVNLNNILGPDTKAKFKSEMDRRRSRRKNKKNAEKREDKLAKKLEEERRKIPARVDPNDEFFQVVGSLESQSSFLDEDNFDTSFPETALSSSPGRRPGAAVPASNDRTFSYNTVCATNGVWPGLESSGLSMSPKTRKQQSGVWGKNTAPPVAGQNATTPTMSKKKKGTKSKRIDLFSTGGGRRI